MLGCPNAEVRFIPNKHGQCLDCISEALNLQSWETVCLQCGEKTDHLKGGNKFCWGCLWANTQKNREIFLASLCDEQKILFEQYEDWSGARTSVIILD